MKKQKYKKYKQIDNLYVINNNLTKEEIIFNTMAKTSNKSFDDLYTMLLKMAEGTYKNQVIKQYKYFESADLKMSKQTAKEIYTQAKKNIKQEEKCC